MKVLIALESMRMGGKERQTIELMKGLCARKVEVMLILLGREDFYANEVAELNIQIRYLIRKVRWDPLLFFELFQVFRSFRPDIVHTTCWMTSFYSYPIARLMNTCFINGSIRNAFNGQGFKWRIERILCKLSDAVIANSKAGLNSRRFIQDCAKYFVVYNGYDFSRSRKARIERSGGKKIVGMVAEFSRYKNYQLFINAAIEILRARDDVTFIAVGDGPTLKDCMKLASGFKDSILFTGNRKDVEQIVSSIDIGVLCSFTEGISNSVLEYMAFGKPVVVTRVGGCDELVVDGVTGWLVEPGSQKEIVEKISSLLDSEEKARQMGFEGQNRVKLLFCLDGMVDHTLDVYNRVLEQKH